MPRHDPPSLKPVADPYAGLQEALDQAGTEQEAARLPIQPLLTATAEALRTLRAMQLEDRAARESAEASLAGLQSLHQHELEQALERLQALEQARQEQAESAEDAIQASEQRAEEVEQQLAQTAQRLQTLNTRELARAQKHAQETSNFVAQIERLRERLAALTDEIEAGSARSSRAQRHNGRFARHASHPLVDGLLQPATGSSTTAEVIMDAPLFARTQFQPVFTPNPKGEYQLTDFLSLYDRNFVRACYLAVLRREPDPEGAENYLRLLRSGEHKARLLGHFMRSDEARRHGTVVHGLQVHLRVLRLCELPVVGRLIAATLFLATVDNHLRDLRVLENHVIRIAEEAQAIHEANLGKLRSLSN